MKNIVDTILGIAFLYRDATVQATRALFRNWPLLIGVVGSYLIVYLVTNIFSSGILGGGFVGGMVVGLIQIVLISIAYSWLRDSVAQERLSLKGLYQLDAALFSSVIHTAFIIFLAKLVLSLFTQSTGHDWVMVLVQFALVIVCNPLPEVLYIQRSHGLHALEESVEFIKRNWIEWFIPLIVVMAPWLFVSTDLLLFLIAKMDELLPATVVFQVVRIFSAPLFSELGAVGTVLSYFLALLFFVWFMLFRGFLFMSMMHGSRRQRTFKAKQ